MALAGFGSPVQEIALERPGDREFVRDRAYMIDDADEIAISELSNSLLTDMAIPIIVVAIESMERYGGGGKGVVPSVPRRCPAS